MNKSQPRTLVKLGTNSLVITLPKKWITNNKLKKGDLVYAREEENRLILENKNKPRDSSREILIELKKKDLDVIKSEVITAYISGFDILKIQGDRIKRESFKVKEIVHNLIGLEIVEQTKSSIIVKELLDLEKTSVNNITHRIDYLIRGMFDDLKICDNDDDYHDLYNRDKEVNRLTYLIFRTINKAYNYPEILSSLKTDRKSLSDVRIIILNLEQIGDYIKRIARVLCSLKDKTSTEAIQIKQLVHFTKEEYLKTMDSFYKFEKEKAMEIELEHNSRLIEYKKFLHDNPKYFNAEISYLLQNISRAIRDISRIICGMEDKEKKK